MTQKADLRAGSLGKTKRDLFKTVAGTPKTKLLKQSQITTRKPD